VIKFSNLNKQWKLSDLKKPFPGIEKVEYFPSGCGHDLFVLQTVNGKDRGRYLEIGSRNPISKNNTYVLEKYFNWEGISLDTDQKWFDEFNSVRLNKTVLQDATTTDYDELLSRFNWEDKVVDYLSMDCEPAHQTFKALQKVMESEYEFKIITFEHDSYSDKGYIKSLSREYLWNMGYNLVANMSTCTHDHEDWWVHSDWFDIDISVNALNPVSIDKFFFN